MRYREIIQESAARGSAISEAPKFGLRRCTAVTINAILAHFGIDPIPEADVPYTGAGVVERLKERGLRSKTDYSSVGMTVRKFVETHPTGAWYLSTRGHALALIDGDLHDTEGRGASGRKVEIAIEFMGAVREAAQQPGAMFFLRDTKNPQADLARGWSCHVGGWFKTEDAALDYQHHEWGGRHPNGKPRQDPSSGRRCGDPEMGLSSFAFHDSASLERAKQRMESYADGNRVAVFTSSDYDLGVGADGEDCFRGGRFVGWLDYENDGWDAVVKMGSLIESTNVPQHNKFWINIRDGRMITSDPEHNQFVLKNPEVFGVSLRDNIPVNIYTKMVSGRGSYPANWKTMITTKMGELGWVRAYYGSRKKEIAIDALTMRDAHKAAKMLADHFGDVRSISIDLIEPYKVMYSGIGTREQKYFISDTDVTVRNFLKTGQWVTRDVE